MIDSWQNRIAKLIPNFAPGIYKLEEQAPFQHWLINELNIRWVGKSMESPTDMEIAHWLQDLLQEYQNVGVYFTFEGLPIEGFSVVFKRDAFNIEVSPITKQGNTVQPVGIKIEVKDMKKDSDQ